MQGANTPVKEDVRMFDDSLYYSPDEAPPAAVAAAPAAMPASGFNKMFPHLDPFWKGQVKQEVLKNLRTLGKKGGLMDAKDPLVTITNPLDANPELNPDNDNPDMTVGFTFLGQFIDHDITLDRQPLSDTGPSFPNERTPFFDLDSVYGKGPQGDPDLYDPAQPEKLRVDFKAPRDLPRVNELKAIIADGRNDENVIISQMHLAFIRFHNRIVDHIRESKPPNLFEEARRLVRWHYQFILVNQYLEASLAKGVYTNVKKNGPTVFKPSPNPQMPREFQVAAFRFGHSQIRPGYKINVGFGAPIFDAALDTRDPLDQRDMDPNDLRGGRRAPRRFVEWDTFFDFGTLEVAIKNGKAEVLPKVKKNKRIDPFISSPLFDLPVGPGLPEPVEDVRTLAARNLERHLMHDLASGQAIATELGYTPLKLSQTKELKPLNLHKSSPLWWYILKEAFVQQDGKRLGQVGSRIIAEVFIGLLLSDSGSYWSTDKNWKPTLPQRDGTVGVNFTMTDLLSFARVA
ncbi:MAG TPA: heme peroxidase family protein [Thermoanaerobaculia bacterium]|nr:heme peroxidase family protein [Thermoanaerobaculia bacterium]